MEYLDGPTLQQRGERNALSLREVVRIGQQLAKGISFLHDHCLLHRDVKPQNVIETHAGRVVLTDFGLAANFDPTERAWEIPPAGTMAYMAPEVAVDSRPPSRASDSYSLVATLFFLVCRHPPAEGESFSDVRRQLSHGIRPALPEGIPNDWTLFFDRGLARVPAARFQTGAEVDEALAALEV